jgi:hypothetical protein
MSETDIPRAVVENSDGTEHTVTDLLANIMFRQMGHMQEYDQISRAKGLPVLAPSQWGNLSSPEVQAKLREFAGYMTEELYEAINLLKNKPWKQTPRETDPGEFYKEMGDFWHFLAEFLIYAGMTPDVVAQYYFGMAKKNDDRRKNGY